MTTNGTAGGGVLLVHSMLLQRLTFLSGVFILGAVIQFMTNLFKIGLPYTVVVFMLGMSAGTTGATSNMIEIGPHLMLNIFMPILIFEGAFAMDVYVLRKVFWQALFMAGPGLVVITGMTAGVAQPLMKNEDWGWKESVLFGSILSATDPVAVVALLKELGASPFLSLFIEGESLLNDGTAMVGFTVFYSVITGTKELSAYNVIVEGFLRFAVGGPLFGYLTARLCLFWLSKTFNDSLSEIAATFTTAFLTFFLAEQALSVSGVLALVVLGVVLSNNRTSISPEVETFLHSFWEVLAYMANTLIFFLVGMIVMRLMRQKAQVWDFVYNFLIYISINSIRAMTVIAFSPLLKRMGYPLPWQFIIVASWSGLRGAVGLALALMVYENEKNIPRDTVSYKVFFHLCGIVFLTLAINATTISKLLSLLGMSDVSNARRAAMATALTFLTEVKQKTMSVWMTDRFLADVDWGFVDKKCTLREPWDLTQDEDEEKINRVWAICPHCDQLVPYQPTSKEMADMRNEAILRLLKAEKLSYWRQFEHGMLSTRAVRILMEICETAADKKGQYMETETIKNTWKHTTITKLVTWIKTTMDISRTSATWIHRNSVRPSYLTLNVQSSEILSRHMFWGVRPRNVSELLTHHIFVVSMAAALYLVLDGSLNVLILVLVVSKHLQSWHGSLSITSVTVWAFMVLYAIVRLVVLRKRYVHSPWFWISVFIFVTGVVEIALLSIYDQFDATAHENKIDNWVNITLAVIRVARMLHALEAFVPLFILVLEKLEVQRLSNGYDVGRGYVMGEEEIRSRIDHMADRRDIIEELRNRCDAAKMEVLKGLGLLQKDNPEVAMGVKTRQAIRSVLNNLRDEVHTLLQDGLLEEAEGNEIAGMIETKMKKLLTAPPKVPLPSTEKILFNVPWIQDNEELVQFIKSRARLMNYEYGDIIMHQDEPTTGLSIILSGLVKLELHIPLDSPMGEQKCITRILDFLTSGNVLGEIGVLTNKPRSATVKCETAVQLLELDIVDMCQAFEKFAYLDPPLKDRLWRLSAMRVCAGIFLDQPAFAGMTKEKLRVRLENGYVEEVKATPTTYTITPYMGEVVLLHGNAIDAYTLDRFIGPCYVPANIGVLCFEDQQIPHPALFVLPSDNQPAICRPSMSMAHDTSTGQEDLGKLSPNRLHMLNTVARASHSCMDRGPAGVVTLRDIRKDERNSILACAGKFRRGTNYYTKPGIARRSLSSNLAVQTSRMAYTTLPTLQSSPGTSISLTDHLPPTIGQNRQSREPSLSSMDKLFAPRVGRFDSKRNSTVSHWQEPTESPSLMWRRNTMKHAGARGSISGWSTPNKSGYRRQSLKRAAASNISNMSMSVRRGSPSQGKPGLPGTAADTNQPRTAADPNQPTVNVNSQRPRAKSTIGLEHSVILESTVSHGHVSILPLPVDDKSKKFSWPSPLPVDNKSKKLSWTSPLPVRRTSLTDPPTAFSQTRRKLSGEVMSRQPSMNARTGLMTSPGPSSGVAGQEVHSSPSLTLQACDEELSSREAARAKRRVSLRDPPENTSQSAYQRESDDLLSLAEFAQSSNKRCSSTTKPTKEGSSTTEPEVKGRSSTKWGNSVAESDTQQHRSWDGKVNAARATVWDQNAQSNGAASKVRRDAERADDSKSPARTSGPTRENKEDAVARRSANKRQADGKNGGQDPCTSTAATAKRTLEQDRSHSSAHDTARLSSSDGQGAERVPSCTDGIQYLMQPPLSQNMSRDRGKWVLDATPVDAIQLRGENTRRRDAIATEGIDGRENHKTNRANARPTSNADGTDVFKAETKSEPRSTQETGQRSDDKGEETKRDPTAGREDRPGATKRNDRQRVPQERRGEEGQAEDTPSSPSRPGGQGQSRDGDQSPSPGQAENTPSSPSRPVQQGQSRDGDQSPSPGQAENTPSSPSRPVQQGQSRDGDHSPSPGQAENTPSSPSRPVQQGQSRDGDRDSPQAQADGAHNSTPPQSSPGRTGYREDKEADSPTQQHALDSDSHGSQPNEADKNQQQLADQLVERGSDSHGSQPNEADKSQRQLADQLVERGSDYHGSQPNEADKSQQQQADQLVEKGSDYHGSQPNEVDKSQLQQADPLVEKGSDSHGSQPNEADKSQQQKADPLVEKGSDSHGSQPNEVDKSQQQQSDPLVEKGSDSHGSLPYKADKSQQQQSDPLVEKGSDSHGSQPNEVDKSQQQQSDPLVERRSDSHGSQSNEADKSQQQQSDLLVEKGSDSHGSQPNEADKSQQQQADPLVEKGSDSHGSQPNEVDKSQQQQSDPLVERRSDSHGSQSNEADKSQQQQSDLLVEKGSDSHGSQPNEADKSQQQQADPLVEKGSDSHGSQPNEADKSQQRQADPLVEKGSDSHGSQPNEVVKSQQQQADPLVERGSDSHGSQPNEVVKSQQQQADPLVERGSDVRERRVVFKTKKSNKPKQEGCTQTPRVRHSVSSTSLDSDHT